MLFRALVGVSVLYGGVPHPHYAVCVVLELVTRVVEVDNDRIWSFILLIVQLVSDPGFMTYEIRYDCREVFEQVMLILRGFASKIIDLLQIFETVSTTSMYNFEYNLTFIM